jgi:hypothetical protein
VRAVAKRLSFGQPARTPPVALALFDLNGNRLPSADLCHFAHNVPSLLVADVFHATVTVRLGKSTARRSISAGLLPQIEGIWHRCQSRNEHKVERCVAHGALIRRVVEAGDRSVDSISERTKDGFPTPALHKVRSFLFITLPMRGYHLRGQRADRAASVRHLFVREGLRRTAAA